jgi:NAD dependent epimerase/dehydratase family enzyme
MVPIDPGPWSSGRRVVPGRLLDEGFAFSFPDWPAAASDLVTRWRAGA